MPALFIDPLRDALSIIPWLWGIYVVLEIVERRYEHLITEKLHRAISTGPLLGALFGCIPQCGFSVIASTLYAQRVISPGTLLAVFLSTSDEAIPVILAQSDRWETVLRILAAKIVIAALAGFTIDFLWRPLLQKKDAGPHDPVFCEKDHGHCCGRSHSCREPWWKSFILFPLKHSLKVFFFIFIVSVALNWGISKIGEENLGRLFFINTPLQPLFAVLIGLLPNCVASVTIAEIYLKGGITFGSAMAGLCAGAGLGTLVLWKENKDWRENLIIIVLLAGISLTVGIVLNFL